MYTSSSYLGQPTWFVLQWQLGGEEGGCRDDGERKGHWDSQWWMYSKTSNAYQLLLSFPDPVLY